MGGEAGTGVGVGQRPGAGEGRAAAPRVGSVRTFRLLLRGSHGSEGGLDSRGGAAAAPISRLLREVSMFPSGSS